MQKIGKTITMQTPKGQKIDFITIGQLAKLADRKPIALRKWEEQGWLPAANFTTDKQQLPNGVERNGYRLYSVKYAFKIAAEIKKVKKGVKMDNAILHQIKILMKEERNEYL